MTQNEGDIPIGTKITAQNWQYKEFMPLGMIKLFEGALRAGSAGGRKQRFSVTLRSRFSRTIRRTSLPGPSTATRARLQSLAAAQTPAV
jgi:hypothetical protein